MTFPAVALLFCVLAVDLSLGQIVSLGSCPNVTVVTGFEATKYIGTWFEQEKYYFIFEAGGSCITAEYGATDESNVISVNNTMINSLGTTSSTTGTATLEDTTDVEAKLNVKFDGNPIIAPYWVLATDYDTYAVVWSCNNVTVSNSNSQNAWILTRDRTASSDVLETARAVLTANNLSTSNLEVTDQTNC